MVKIYELNLLHMKHIYFVKFSIFDNFCEIINSNEYLMSIYILIKVLLLLLIFHV